MVIEEWSPRLQAGMVYNGSVYMECTPAQEQTYCWCMRAGSMSRNIL